MARFERGGFAKPKLIILAASLAAATTLPGCATVQTKTAYYRGNTPDLQKDDIERFAADQDAIVQRFEAMAGTPNLANGSDWRPVVDVGMQYVDVRCSRFMDALFWLNRARDTSSRQIHYLGAATSALLALVNATKELIGIAPLGFGLADQTINNVGQGLLYNLDPGTVAGLVGRQQAAYRAAIKGASYTNRGAAMQAIQQYAALCLPVSIEGEVNRAITNSEFKAVNSRSPARGENKESPPQPTPPAAAGSIPASNENIVPVIQQKQPEDGQPRP